MSSRRPAQTAAAGRQRSYAPTTRWPGRLTSMVNPDPSSLATSKTSSNRKRGQPRRPRRCASGHQGRRRAGARRRCGPAGARSGSRALCPRRPSLQGGVPTVDRLGGSLEQRPLSDGKPLKLGVEGVARRAECDKKGTPILFVLPAVDRQVAVVSASVAVQLGTHEPRGPSEQLTPGAVACIARDERRGPVIWHLVLPHPHEHASSTTHRTACAAKRHGEQTRAHTAVPGRALGSHTEQFLGAPHTP